MKKTFKLIDLDCANCAAKMEQAIGKLDGVTGVMPRKSFSADSVRLIAGNAGRYVAEWAPVAGLALDKMEQMGFQLTEGEPATKSGEVVLG